VKRPDTNEIVNEIKGYSRVESPLPNGPTPASRTSPWKRQ
jgi:hypothetical protein